MEHIGHTKVLRATPPPTVVVETMTTVVDSQVLSYIEFAGLIFLLSRVFPIPFIWQNTGIQIDKCITLFRDHLRMIVRLSELVLIILDF